MIPERFKGQIIVDVAALIVFLIVLLIYYFYTKPQENYLIKKFKINKKK